MALYLSVEAGDSIKIGSSTITIEAKTGRRTRLRIDSSEDVDHEQAGTKPAVKAPMPEAAPAPEPEPAPAPPSEPKQSVLTRPMFPAAR